MIILSTKASAKLKIDACQGIVISDDLASAGPEDVFVGFGGMIRQRREHPEKKIFSCETGFFYGTCHLDAHGLYDRSSLYRPDIESRIFPLVQDEWLDELRLLEGKVFCGQSKYKQPEDHVPMDDFVLIPAQRPKDNQIKSVRDKRFGRDYYYFLDEVLRSCFDTGKKIVIKKHPMSSPDEDVRMSSMATRYGGIYGAFSLQSCLANCERIVAYNSTVIVDAMFYDRPIFMLAPGYFSHFDHCVTTCTVDEAVVSNGKVDIGSRKRLLAFLYRAYCVKRHGSNELILSLEGERKWEADSSVRTSTI